MSFNDVMMSVSMMSAGIQLTQRCYHHERRFLPRVIYRSVVRMGEVYEAQHIKLFEQNHECGLARALAPVRSKNQYGKKFYISPKSGEP